jgi:DNA-binding NarL/FixJ family response regulator
MRILLADSGAPARFALCTLLEQHPGWRVVGEVSSAEQLPGQVIAKNPDVLLLEWNLPQLKAEDFIPSIKEKFPKLSIIVLSGRPELKAQALSAGADMFVSKADPPDRLLDAISFFS